MQSQHYADERTHCESVRSISGRNPGEQVENVSKTGQLIEEDRLNRLKNTVPSINWSPHPLTTSEHISRAPRAPTAPFLPQEIAGNSHPESSFTNFKKRDFLRKILGITRSQSNAYSVSYSFPLATSLKSPVSQRQEESTIPTDATNLDLVISPGTESLSTFDTGYTSTYSTSTTRTFDQNPELTCLQGLWIGSSPSDPKVLEVWNTRIRHRLRSELFAHISETFTLEFLLSGKTPDDLRPTILVTSVTKSGKKDIEKLYKSLGWLRSLNKQHRIRFVSLLSRAALVSLTKPDISTAIDRGYMEVYISKNDQTYCGCVVTVIDKLAQTTSYCTASGLVLVDGQAYILTTGHAFREIRSDDGISQGQAKTGLLATSYVEEDREDGNSSSDGSEPCVIDEDSDGSVSVAWPEPITEAGSTETAVHPEHDVVSSRLHTDHRVQTQLLHLCIKQVHPHTDLDDSSDHDWALLAVPENKSLLNRDVMSNILTDYTVVPSESRQVKIIPPGNQLGSEMLTGILHPLTTTLHMSGSRLEAYRITTSHIWRSGTSGALVLLDGQICGQIVAAREDGPWLYMLSIIDTFDDIITQLGANRVYIYTENVHDQADHESIMDPVETSTSRDESGHQWKHVQTPEDMPTAIEHNTLDSSDVQRLLGYDETETELLTQVSTQRPTRRHLSTFWRSVWRLGDFMKSAFPLSATTQRRNLAYVDELNTQYATTGLEALESAGYELQEVDNTISLPESIHAQNVTPHGVDIEYDTSISPSFSGIRKRKTLGSSQITILEPTRDSCLSDLSLPLHFTIDEPYPAQRFTSPHKACQNLAEKREEIMAFNENFSPSSLDPSSSESSHLRSMGATDMISLKEFQPKRHSWPISENMLSYFFPTDPNIPDWKPFSMRRPYVVMMLLLSLGLAASQEYVYHLSQGSQIELFAFNDLDDLSTGMWLLLKYLPSMITIIYSILFSIMDFDLRRLEPYYQMSQFQGSQAAAGLNLDYRAMIQYVIPIEAARLRQWTVFASSVGYIVAATITPALQISSLNLQVTPSCNKSPCSDGSDGTRFLIHIVPGVLRALSISYIFLACILIFLLFQLRRKSGLLSDPRGIASIMCMATKSRVLQDFIELDPATDEQIEPRLRNRRYVLHKSSIWQGRLTPDTKSIRSKSRQRSQCSHPTILQLKVGAAFISVMLIGFVAIPVIALTPAKVILSRILPILVTVTTILKTLWSTLEVDIRLIEPFYQLSQGNSRSHRSLTLDYQSTPYVWVPIQAALNGDYIVALASSGMVLFDVLSILIGSFRIEGALFESSMLRPNSTSDGVSEAKSMNETSISYLNSVVLSMVILGFTICTALIVYAKRRHPFLPRKPFTIAAVLSFIHNSKMLYDFVDTETFSAKTMDTYLTRLNKRYSLGFFVGRDKKVHYGIDEEPIVSRYVPGKPYEQALGTPMVEDFVT